MADLTDLEAIERMHELLRELNEDMGVWVAYLTRNTPRGIELVFMTLHSDTTVLGYDLGITYLETMVRMAREGIENYTRQVEAARVEFSGRMATGLQE